INYSEFIKRNSVKIFPILKAHLDLTCGRSSTTSFIGEFQFRNKTSELTVLLLLSFNDTNSELRRFSLADREPHFLFMDKSERSSVTFRGGNQSIVSHRKFQVDHSGLIRGQVNDLVVMAHPHHDPQCISCRSTLRICDR